MRSSPPLPYTPTSPGWPTSCPFLWPSFHFYSGRPSRHGRLPVPEEAAGPRDSLQRPSGTSGGKPDSLNDRVTSLTIAVTRKKGRKTGQSSFDTSLCNQEPSEPGTFIARGSRFPEDSNERCTNSPEVERKGRRLLFTPYRKQTGRDPRAHVSFPARSADRKHETPDPQHAHFSRAGRASRRRVSPSHKGYRGEGEQHRLQPGVHGTDGAQNRMGSSGGRCRKFGPPLRPSVRGYARL